MGLSALRRKEWGCNLSGFPAGRSRDDSFPPRDHNSSVSSRRSTESSNANPELEGQHPITCTSSNHSDISTYSGYAPSVTSVSSVSSTTSTSLMVIPLHNLQTVTQARNVMTNAALELGRTRPSRSFWSVVSSLSVSRFSIPWKSGITEGRVSSGPSLFTEPTVVGVLGTA